MSDATINLVYALDRIIDARVEAKVEERMAFAVAQARLERVRARAGLENQPTAKQRAMEALSR